MFVIVIETNFETRNLIKIVLTKETVDQIRFPVKLIVSLEHFRCIFYRNFSN